MPRRDRSCCPRCLHPGFALIAADDSRPMFVCDRCAHTWTFGKSGGKYAGHEMNKEKTNAAT